MKTEKNNVFNSCNSLSNITSNQFTVVTSPSSYGYGFGSSGASGYSGTSGTSGYSIPIGYKPAQSFNSCLENAIKKLNLNYNYKVKYNFPKVEIIFKSKNSIFFKQKFKINIDINDGNYPYNDKLEELLTSNIKKQIREINLNKLL